MISTTCMDLIPNEFHPKQKENATTTPIKPVESQPEADPVFKVFEKDRGWRSFRCSQIVSIKMTLGSKQPD